MNMEVSKGLLSERRIRKPRKRRKKGRRRRAGQDGRAGKVGSETYDDTGVV